MKVLDIDGLNYYDGKIKQTYATKSYVDTQDALKAPLASPALTGTPTSQTPSTDDNSTKIATTAYVKSNLGNYATLNGATFTGAVNGVTPTAGDSSTKLATTAYVQEELRQHASMPIGHEYFTMNPNVPQGSLPLFGGEYSRSTYADLWAWVQTQTGYCKTEAEWQTLSASNNGNVPFYSSGDGSTTFRVPSLKCWVKSANGTVSEVGSYLEAGLPNIDGEFGTGTNGYYVPIRDGASGAFSNAGYSTFNTASSGGGSTTGYQYAEFHASNSNSIYGNSTTVQPESIVGMWLVKAYGTIEETGTIDEQQYIDDRIAAEVTRADGKYLPLAGGTLNGALGVHYSANNVDGYIVSTQWGLSLHADSPVFEDTGASLTLNSKYLNSENLSNYLGDFTLSAFDGTTRKALVGKPNGTLTWNGVSITDGTFLTVRNVNVTTRSGTLSYNISAPAVSGYQFLCWVMSATSGYVNYSYITAAWNANASFWMGNPDNGSVDCTALYVRKW